MWTTAYTPGSMFELRDMDGNILLRRRGGMLPDIHTREQLARVPDLIKALRDLTLRVDNTPIEDGSNMDTCEAHALLQVFDAL